MDVKNILAETVSHHILPQMLVSPLWVDLSNLLKDYLKFMDDHFREFAELAFLAYRHRNYSKVSKTISFMDFILQKFDKQDLQILYKYLLKYISTMCSPCVLHA